MVSKNFLCIKYGTPEDILKWLLRDGFIMEVLYYGSMMGTAEDHIYLKRIEKLSTLSKVDGATIKKTDLKMPSCCSCRTISESFSDMPAFKDEVERLLNSAAIDTVAKGSELTTFINGLKEACTSEKAYKTFADILSSKYIYEAS